MARPTPGAGRATALLVAVTAVWGSTFVLIRDLVHTVPSSDFLAVRFALAAACMLVLFRGAVARLRRRDWLAGLGLGAVYALAQLLQTVGLEHTPASRSGFLTGLYVVLTPVLGALVLRQRVPRATWAAVVLALAGTAVLSLGDPGADAGAGGALGIGEVLTIASAGVYAVHILGLGRLSEPHLATGLATVQVLAVAVVSLLAALPGGLTTPATAGGWASLVYLAVVGGALAMWAQTWAQAHLPAARAAVVMTMEPVFAAAFAVAVGGEHLTARMVLGGGLVLGAMYVVELAGRRDAVPLEAPLEALHHEG